MRTRFLNIDYFTPSPPIQTLDPLTFLHLPIPSSFTHPSLSAADVLRSLSFGSLLLEASLQIEQLPIRAALSKFFSAVLPQNVAVDVEDFESAAEPPRRSAELRFSEEANIHKKQKWLDNHITAGSDCPEAEFQKEDNRAYRDKDALHYEVLQFETQELDVFLENDYIYDKEEIPIPSQIPEETLDLTMEYPWEVHESVHTVEDFQLEHPKDQKAYSSEDGASYQDAMHSYQIPFPMLEANEISLLNLTALSIQDELTSVYENIEPQHCAQNLNGKELLGSKEYGMLELLSDHCISKQCVGLDLSSLDIPPAMDLLTMVEISQSQGDTTYKGTGIGSCLQSANPVVFQEFLILDLDSSLTFEVLFSAQTVNEPETCDWMFNGEMNFNNLIVSHELALVDDTFKSLPVPVLSDHEKISSSYFVIQETLTHVQPQPLSASDRIYLDWHLVEKDSTCQVYSCQEKMLEDINLVSIDFYWDSFDDRKFYDLAFSDDAVDNTEVKELQEFLSDAIPVLTGRCGSASTRLSGDNIPLTNVVDCLDKRISVDGLNTEKSMEFQLSDSIHIRTGHLGEASKKVADNFPHPKNGEHLDKKGSGRTSLLYKSMPQFNDVDFFLNHRKASTDGRSDCAVSAVDNIALCSKVEQSHSICAQVEDKKEPKSKELLNSFTCQEEYGTRSKEDSDGIEASSIPPPIHSMPSTIRADPIHPDMVSFPEIVIVVNTQNIDKEMIVSRRSTYQKILALEKKGAQVIERDSDLPVDIIISSAVCLVWYNCRNIEKAAALEEASACLALCIENIASNVLTLLSIAFSGCILIFEGETSFLSTVMESSDGLYAAAASLGMDLQLFTSYSSELTDEIILSGIQYATKLVRGVYPQMPESENLAESFLTKFPSVNALTAHAILCSGGSLIEFLKWSHEKRIHAVRNYHVPDEIISLFSAICRYGERGDSKSIMTDSSSSVSTGSNSGRYNQNVSERKRRKYNGSPDKYDVQMNDSVHQEPYNVFTNGISDPPAASKLYDSCISKSPTRVDEFRKSKFNDSLQQEPYNVFNDSISDPPAASKLYDSCMSKSPTRIDEFRKSKLNDSLQQEPYNVFNDSISDPPAASKLYDSCMSKSLNRIDEFRKSNFPRNDMFDQGQDLDMSMMMNPFMVPEQYDSPILEQPRTLSGTKRSCSSLKDNVSDQKQRPNMDMMKKFSLNNYKNSVNLHDDAKGEVIDLTDGPVFDVDFSSIANSTEFSSLMPEFEIESTRKYKSARKLSFGSNSHRTFPTAAEIESGSTVRSSEKEPRQSSQVGVTNYSDKEVGSGRLPSRRHCNFLEEGFRQRSSGISPGMHLHENDVAHYGGTQLSNALHSGTPQQNSPWTIEFLNKIKEKSKLRQQSFPRDLSSPILGHPGSAVKVTKRRSPSILEFFKYQGGSTPRKLPERKKQKRHSSSTSKVAQSSAPLTTWTPVDKRSKQTLSFAMNKSGSQTKLVWSDGTHGLRNKFQSR